jgi:hypothetical protein
MHFVQYSTVLLYHQTKTVCWLWIWSGMSFFTLSSYVNWWSITSPSLKVRKNGNQKAQGPKLYDECLRIPAFSSWRVFLSMRDSMRQHIYMWDDYTFFIIILTVLCEWSASFLFITHQNSLYFLSWFHVPGNIEGYGVVYFLKLENCIIILYLLTKKFKNKKSEHYRLSDLLLNYYSLHILSPQLMLHFAQ